MMTVKELKDILSKFNDNDVIISYNDESCASFEFTPTMIFSKTRKKFKEEYDECISSYSSNQKRTLYEVKDELSPKILNSLKSDDSNVIIICTDY